MQNSAYGKLLNLKLFDNLFSLLLYQTLDKGSRGITMKIFKILKIQIFVDTDIPR